MKREPDMVAQDSNLSTGDAQARRTGINFKLT